MNPVKKISDIFEIIIITFAAAAANCTYHFLTNLETDATLAVILSILVVPISKVLLSYFGRFVFSKLLFLRKLLLGSRFFEGTYIEILHEGKEFVSIGIAWIEISGDGIILHGYDYSPDGNINYHWKSQKDMVSIEWPWLHYSYSCTPHDTVKTYRGVAQMHFSKSTKGRPKTYAGSFIHAESGQHVGFEGWLLEDKESLKAVYDPNELPNLFKNWLDKKS